MRLNEDSAIKLSKLFTEISKSKKNFNNLGIFFDSISCYEINYDYFLNIIVNLN